MIPLKQWITRSTSDTMDAWGIMLPGSKKTIPCRIEEKHMLVKDSHGKEVVSTAEILLRGLVKIGFNDVMEWTDENGVSYSRQPLSVSVLRDFGGKPVFTKVVV
ncbi:hypothetical protein GJ688_19275 [Heliobacillus mobilis]|uniref:Uncharacterized protein n=1 Tax=Heliobacterium mobile TaxID=28064 RepID=A0A6I3SRQ0_HELMO|nr:hypothetical protein [Heliobacterium mobile]MTV51042.1 hypothetical protein [Heliobacterium mobile]